VLGSPDFRILKANRALCQMLGYTEGELTGLRFADITHPEDAERTLQLGRSCSVAKSQATNSINATSPKASESSGQT